MSESAIEQSNAILNDIYYWHPKFSVYILDNLDVLLISESQQILLPSDEYQWASLLNGKNSLQSIILEHSDSLMQGPLFFQKYENYIKSSVLIKNNNSLNYIKPNFKTKVTEKNCSEYKHCQIINLSVINNLEAEKLLEIFFENNSNSNDIKYQIILVDDFVDPRLKNINFNHDFIVIKISGEDIWVSPLYSIDEVDKFHALLDRISHNQPVRQYLRKQFPDENEALAFNYDELTVNNFSYLSDITCEQFKYNNEKNLIIYERSSHTINRHNANVNIFDIDEFIYQLQSPVILTTCISHYQQDGGSRRLPAHVTVEKLQSLVNPITGLINHLELVNSDLNNGIKIYRSGFFKTPNASDNIKIDQESFVQLCMGKGVADDQSKASALCESIERYSALYQDSIPLYKSKQSKLTNEGKRSLSYQDLQPFSQRQYQAFSYRLQLGENHKQLAKPYDDSEIHWLPLWSLTQQEAVLAPLSLCFSNVPFNDNEYGRWHSNGCAAGNSLEEAIFQALLELIERDAVAIWWYNRVIRPKFDLSRLNQENLKKIHATLSPTVNQGHDYWVIDLTHDIGVPVMVAIGRNKTNGGWIMGFGCHLIAELAAQRALTELCQLIPIREQNSAPFDFDAIDDQPYLYGDQSELINDKNKLLTYNKDIQKNIQNIISRLDKLGFETLVLNYSRSNIPINTVKVFVPGLCHIWPQLGNDRLYRLPTHLSWLDKANNETSINQQGLFV